MANDTKVAALFMPSTQRMHRDLGDRIVDVLASQPHKEWTRQLLADAVMRPVNCVTAPIKMLLDSGIIIEDKRVRDEKTKALRWTLKLKEQNAEY